MKLRAHNAVTSRFDGYRIDPRILQVTPGYNVRDFSTEQAKESMEILKEQIREEGGVIVPLEVRQVGDELHIVSGHRRHRAVMELLAEGFEIESVPAIPEPRGTNDTEREFRLILHNQGEPLTALEKAEVIRRLMRRGLTRQDIQKRLGYRSQNSVINFELLLEAPEQLRDAVRDDVIAPSTAVEMVREYGEKAPYMLPDVKERAAKRGKSRASIRDVKEPHLGGMSAAEVEARNQKRLDEFSRKAEKADNDLAKMEQVLSILLEFEAKGLKPETVADAFGTRKSDVILTAADWLMGFFEALRVKEAKKASMPTEIEPGYLGSVH
jgi:ParB/RepB/Spo0J family partition protein